MNHSILKSKLVFPAFIFVLVLTGLNVFADAPAKMDSPSFILDGKEYTLPFDYSILEENGWITSNDVDSDLGDNTVTSIVMNLKGSEDEPQMNFRLFNGSGSTKKIRECQISNISVTEQDLEWYSFELSNGLKPGDDMKTVTDVMGTPDNINETDSLTEYSYGDENNGGEIIFTWYNDDLDYYEKMDNITLEYYLRTK